MLYNDYINSSSTERIKKLNEKLKNTTDKHERYRIEEEKLLQGLFDLNIGTVYGKYRSPW